MFPPFKHKNMISAYRYISFDLFGTLVDVRTAACQFFVQALGCGGERALELYDAWNSAVFDQISKQNIPFREAAALHLGQIDKGVDVDSFLKAYAGALPFPDVGAVLKKLRERYVLVAITNSDRSMISHVKITHLFHEIITAEDVGYCYKPRREIFDFALKNLNCSKEDLLHVASSVRADVKGAVPLGWNVIYLNRYNIRPLPTPLAVIEKIDELLEFVGSTPR